jgi:hypothetical protein
MAVGLEHIRRGDCSGARSAVCICESFRTRALFEAIHAYRSNFKPSTYLDKAISVGGHTLVAAESDEEAGRLATSAFQRHLDLLRGQPIFVPAPVARMRSFEIAAEVMKTLEASGCSPYQNLCAMVSDDRCCHSHYQPGVTSSHHRGLYRAEPDPDIRCFALVPV